MAAAALILGGVLLVVLLNNTLTENVEVAADLRAEDVVALLEGGVEPDRISIDRDEDSLVQILDDAGAVIAASPQLSGLRAIAKLRPEQARTLELADTDQPDPYRVVALSTQNGDYLVLVARSLEPVRESAAVLTRGLLVGLPLLIILIAVITWVVTGKALRPVESIRAQVAAINGNQLSKRVPEPESNDEIARLARTMNAMLERLEHSRDRQRRFVSDASHELRSPIATIRHQLETAMAHPGSSSLDDLAPDLLAENQRMQQLVSDLLLLARTDEDTAHHKRHPVDLDDILLAEAIRIRSLGIGQVNEIVVDTTGVSAGQTIGDAGQLSRLVRNLVDNAVRHARSRMWLALRADSGRLRLTVSDDGDGVAEADATRIFDRFARLDNSRTRETGGAGLGLAIVAEVARAHGGSVHVEPMHGEPRTNGSDGTQRIGARFVVDLPAASD